MTSHAAAASAPARVSTLELFFDLVFVFTITQVSTVVEHAPGWAGLGRAALELWVIAWMYGGFAYLTNSAGPDTWQRRLLLLGGMAGFFICALAVPRAFDENGIVFGAGYLLVNVLHFTGFALRPGRTSLSAIYRLAPFNLISAALVLAAGWTHGTTDWLLWGGAVALQVATPLLARSSDGFVLNAEHFAERHGLMILIVLGESLISVGLAVEHHDHVDTSLLFGALAGLAVTSAMWWAYFVGEDERAAEAFGAASARVRADEGLIGYGLAHLVMMFGLVAVAAGTKLSVNDLAAHASLAGAWLMAGGAATYLLGGALFRVALRFASLWTRVIGSALCLTAVIAGTRSSTATDLRCSQLTLWRCCSPNITYRHLCGDFHDLMRRMGVSLALMGFSLIHMIRVSQLLFLSGVLLCGVVAPASAQSRSRSLAALATTGTQSDSVAVHAAMTGFLDALNELDVPRMSADFADDITAFVPSVKADRVEGKAAVTAIFSAFAERGKAAPRATSVADDMRIEVSGSLAIVHFMVHDAPPKPTRRRTFVWRKVGTRWLISHFHASDIASPAR